jgi:cardiolipin synthase
MTRLQAVRLLAAMLLGLLASSGCGYPNHPHDLRIHEQVPPGGEALSAALYQSTGTPLLPGHTVTLVENGAVFDVLEADILGARRSIHLLAFIWRPGEASDRLVRAVERRHPGVACRILVDSVGSNGFQGAVQHALSRAGCEVRLFRPVHELITLRHLWRTHRKLLVVDGEHGITGGFGIQDPWLGHGMRPEEWRDTNVRVSGPAVAHMQRAFAENWQEAGGGLLPLSDFPPLGPVGEARAGFVSSTNTRTLSDAERMTQLMVASAQRRLWIANAYFIPSTALADMLIAKRKQGVDVRVLVPGRVHDQPLVLTAQRSTYERLLEGGVRLFEYQPSLMHSKTMLVDEALVVVGSTNLDPLALRYLEEGSLVVEDATLAAHLERSFLNDLRYSLEVRSSWWSRMGALERLYLQLPALIGRYL